MTIYTIFTQACLQEKIPKAKFAPLQPILNTIPQNITEDLQRQIANLAYKLVIADLNEEKWQLNVEILTTMINCANDTISNYKHFWEFCMNLCNIESNPTQNEALIFDIIRKFHHEKSNQQALITPPSNPENTFSNQRISPFSTTTPRWSNVQMETSHSPSTKKIKYEKNNTDNPNARANKIKLAEITPISQKRLHFEMFCKYINKFTKLISKNSLLHDELCNLSTEISDFLYTDLQNPKEFLTREIEHLEEYDTSLPGAKNVLNHIIDQTATEDLLLNLFYLEFLVLGYLYGKKNNPPLTNYATLLIIDIQNISQKVAAQNNPSTPKNEYEQYYKKATEQPLDQDFIFAIIFPLSDYISDKSYQATIQPQLENLQFLLSVEDTKTRSIYINNIAGILANLSMSISDKNIPGLANFALEVTKTTPANKLLVYLLCIEIMFNDILVGINNNDIDPTTPLRDILKFAEKNFAHYPEIQAILSPHIDKIFPPQQLTPTSKLN